MANLDPLQLLRVHGDNVNVIGDPTGGRRGGMAGCEGAERSEGRGEGGGPNEAARRAGGGGGLRAAGEEEGSHSSPANQSQAVSSNL